MRWKRRLRATSSLRFPLPAPARVAVLATGFSLDRNAREFAPEDVDEMRDWAPEALVAPLDVALSLAERRRRGEGALDSVNAAIVVLTAVDGEPLADAHRELLWRAFGVPVFEQVRAADGTVVARECEVHDGLHVDEVRVARELTFLNAAMSGAVVNDPCECGSEKPRFIRAAAV